MIDCTCPFTCGEHSPVREMSVPDVRNRIDTWVDSVIYGGDSGCWTAEEGLTRSLFERTPLVTLLRVLP